MRAKDRSNMRPGANNGGSPSESPGRQTAATSRFKKLQYEKNMLSPGTGWAGGATRVELEGGELEQEGVRRGRSGS